MIIFDRHIRRIALELIAPGISAFDIQRITIAVHLPQAGNGEVIPSFVVKINFIEVERPLVGIPHPVEFPGSVNRHKVGGLLLFTLQGRIFRFIGEIMRVHRGTVDSIHFRIHPFRLLLCIGRHKRT